MPSSTRDSYAKKSPESQGLSREDSRKIRYEPNTSTGRMDASDRTTDCVLILMPKKSHTSAVSGSESSRPSPGPAQAYSI